ncbi:MAG TPA: cytochrome c oxidase assembly protein [Caulobacteraceae bacterium]|nr:cytochrome c oxidase assembly protein [Caulobacteraceae bacterium]
MAKSSAASRNARLALICAAVFVGMVGAAFASVPLYRKFCAATGFNGTVRRAEAASGVVSNQTVVVNFDTNVNGLPWKFEAAQGAQTVRLGESKLAFFRATNVGKVPVTGRSLYNVLPETAGPYFSKLECFCFKNQTIMPGQTVEFPVVYYVDPRFAQDRDNKGQQITLSYTFFPATDQSAAKAAQAAAAASSAKPGAGANGRAETGAVAAAQGLGGRRQARL